jgi:hypothetical protein
MYNAFSIRRPLNGKSRRAIGPREGSEIGRLQFDSLFRLTRFREKLHIGKAGPRHDERIAFLKRVLRLRRSQ